LQSGTGLHQKAALPCSRQALGKRLIGWLVLEGVLKPSPEKKKGAAVAILYIET